MASKTTTSMIDMIKLKGSFPTSNNLFSNQNFLSILNDEVSNTILPLLQRVNEDFFLADSDHTITPSSYSFRIPSRAAGGILRDVQIIDSNNNVIGLNRLYEEDKRSTDYTNGSRGYYIKNNTIIVSGVSSGTLRLVYFRRPSQYVLPTACAQVTAIDTNLNQITVSSLPSSFSTSTVVDFVQASSPYDILAQDASIVSISGTTLEFSSLPTDLELNDYICLAGETCTPQIPEDLVPVLVQASLCVCLSSKKDNSVELELQKLEQMKATFLDYLNPRTKSDDKKIRPSVISQFFKRY